MILQNMFTGRSVLDLVALFQKLARNPFVMSLAD